MLLPLCPVYGLGMLAVLTLPNGIRGSGWLFLFGGMAATAVEYAVHWWYETFLGVRFWEYSGQFGNLRGRVCLPFALIWGVLTTATVRWVHPFVSRLAAVIPPTATYAALLLFTLDAVCSARFLKVTGDIDALGYTTWNR